MSSGGRVGSLGMGYEHSGRGESCGFENHGPDVNINGHICAPNLIGEQLYEDVEVVGGEFWEEPIVEWLYWVPQEEAEPRRRSGSERNSGTDQPSVNVVHPRLLVSKADDRCCTA